MPVKTAFMADHKGDIRRSSAVLYGGLRVEGEAEHKNSGEQKYKFGQKRTYFFHSVIIIQNVEKIQSGL